MVRIALEALRVRVRIEDEAIFKSLRSLSIEGLPARVNDTLQSDPSLLSIRINSAQLLASGDLKIYTEKAEDNEILTYNARVRNGFEEQVHVLRDTFSVVLHGVITASEMDITTMVKV